MHIDYSFNKVNKVEKEGLMSTDTLENIEEIEQQTSMQTAINEETCLKLAMACYDFSKSLVCRLGFNPTKNREYKTKLKTAA